MSAQWPDERDPVAEGFLKRVLIGWCAVVLASLVMIGLVDLPLWPWPIAWGLAFFAVAVAAARADEKRALR